MILNLISFIATFLVIFLLSFGFLNLTLGNIKALNIKILLTLSLKDFVFTIVILLVIANYVSFYLPH